MISCTEFIPAYSELFSYLDEKFGEDEVRRFWEYLFEPTGEGIPLINYVKKEGIRGCFSYWAGSLNEEAADFTMRLSEKGGWFTLEMHRCPSKGRLLELKKTLGLKPYKKYCLHCDSYRSAVERVGLKYIYDFTGSDEASCSILIYDPEIFDGRVIPDSDTVVMQRCARDNDYFHRDFHSSMNMGIDYLGRNYGEGCVEEFLTRYADAVYKKTIEESELSGIDTVRTIIESTYKKERAEELVCFEEGEGMLTVKVAACPAVAHLKATGRAVCPWFKYTTSSVMKRLAQRLGLDFSLIEYSESDGACVYSFTAPDANNV